MKTVVVALLAVCTVFGSQMLNEAHKTDICVEGFDKLMVSPRLVKRVAGKYVRVCLDTRAYIIEVDEFDRLKTSELNHTCSCD